MIICNFLATIAEDLDNVANLISKAAANDLMNELHNEISAYVSLSYLENSSCKICDKLFICYRTIKRDYDNKLETWIQPDLSILNDLNQNNILKFDKTLNPTKYILDNTDLACFSEIADRDWEEFNTSYQNTDDTKHNFKFEAPSSCKKVICGDKASISALDFFKLDTIEDIWSSNNTNKVESPTLVSHEPDASPVLNTFQPKPRITISKNLFESPTSSNLNKPNLSNLNSVRKSSFFKSKNCSIGIKEESNETKPRNHIKELFSNINDFCDLSAFGIEPASERKDVDIKEYSNSGSEDLFGSCSNSPVKNDNVTLDNRQDFNPLLTSKTSQTFARSPDLICEDDFQEKISPVLSKDFSKIKSQIHQQDERGKGVEINKETKVDDICDLSIFGIKPTTTKDDQSQLPITQILNLINKDSSQKENQRIENNIQRNIIPLSPIIGTNKRKHSSSKDDSFESPENKIVQSQKHPFSAKKKQIKKKKNPGSRIINCDSDDDFEDLPFKKSDGWIRVKKPAPPQPSPKPSTPKIRNQPKQRTSQPKKRVFFIKIFNRTDFTTIICFRKSEKPPTLMTKQF